MQIFRMMRDMISVIIQKFIHCTLTSTRKYQEKIKDKSAGAILESFVGLRSKMYSLRHQAGHADKDAQKAKGIKKSTIRTLQHDDYIKCLFDMEQRQHTFHSIRSQNHQLFTIKQKKTSLSAFDDKRYLLNCSVHSLPYGHKRLKSLCDEDSGTPVKRLRCRHCE